MEHTLVQLVHAAAWFFLIVFAFALIGVIATIRWIVAMVTGAEHAVESGVSSVEHKLHGD